jgi:hypothetical protein
VSIHDVLKKLGIIGSHHEVQEVICEVKTKKEEVQEVITKVP